MYTKCLLQELPCSKPDSRFHEDILNEPRVSNAFLIQRCRLWNVVPQSVWQVQLHVGGGPVWVSYFRTHAGAVGYGRLGIGFECCLHFANLLCGLVWMQHYYSDVSYVIVAVQIASTCEMSATFVTFSLFAILCHTCTLSVVIYVNSLHSHFSTNRELTGLGFLFMHIRLRL